jgi:solute carrier family 25 phosphate transporter 3
VAGASAEFFGDIALSPFEAAKVRIQTSPPGTFPTTLRKAAPKVYREKTWGQCYGFENTIE